MSWVQGLDSMIYGHPAVPDGYDMRKWLITRPRARGFAPEFADVVVCVPVGVSAADVLAVIQTVYGTVWQFPR